MQLYKHLIREPTASDLRLMKKNLNQVNPVIYLMILVVCEPKLVDNQLDLFLWVQQNIFYFVVKVVVDTTLQVLKNDILVGQQKA